ncbi:ATP-binding protein [Nonomuraea rhodomycinica]|uniref:histidine kinase n=2 Tax=Nonomuraea rhodomycinica TaxID=1712872 RepID=A0A7Y6IQ03_9ACTN|nr:ATP-binding protein [Nonomuraea rhodomycinica]
MDAGLAAVFALTAGYVAYRIAGSWGGGAWWFGCAAGTVVCVIALLRRGHRARAAAAGLAVAAAAVLTARLAHLPAEPGPAMALALAVLIGSAVRALPRRQAGAVAAGGLAVAVLAFAASAAHATVAELYGLAWLAATGLALGARLLRARRRAAMERVRRDERLRLARELHDVVAHHVTSVVLQTQAARLVARRRPDGVDACLAGIEAAGSDALAGARRVVGLLRDDTPSPAPAPAAVSPHGERLGELVRRFTGPPVRLRLPEGEPGWPPEVATTVYRIVQESLTNVSRHAPHAGSVSVTVAEDHGVITVEVADDAPPVPARRLRRGGAGGGLGAGARGGGYGLVGMRERLDALGGTLTAGPRPRGAGWAVRATLPVPARGRR